MEARAHSRQVNANRPTSSRLCRLREQRHPVGRAVKVTWLLALFGHNGAALT